MEWFKQKFLEQISLNKLIIKKCLELISLNKYGIKKQINNKNKNEKFKCFLFRRRFLWISSVCLKHRGRQKG